MSNQAQYYTEEYNKLAQLNYTMNAWKDSYIICQFTLSAELIELYTPLYNQNFIKEIDNLYRQTAKSFSYLYHSDYSQKILLYSNNLKKCTELTEPDPSDLWFCEESLGKSKAYLNQESLKINQAIAEYNFSEQKTLFSTVALYEEDVKTTLDSLINITKIKNSLEKAANLCNWVYYTPLIYIDTYFTTTCKEISYKITLADKILFDYNHLKSCSFIDTSHPEDLFWKITSCIEIYQSAQNTYADLSNFDNII